MEHILCVKSDQCVDFCLELLDTKRKILVEDTNNEFWGCGKSGTGRNILGVLLTEVRQYKLCQLEKV